jgi:Zn-dependent peptidase ImmA (M78 family)
MKFTDLSKKELCGDCCPETFVIYIDKNLDPDLQAKTILHEVIHAVFFRMGIENTTVDENMREILCDLIAAVIQENFKIDFS